MVIVLFQTRLRSEVDRQEYEQLSARMNTVARGMPGFLSYDTLMTNDGREIGMVKFDTEEHLEAWRTHPEHLKAQQRGRESFYESYSEQVCRTVKEYSFKRGEGRRSA